MKYLLEIWEAAKTSDKIGLFGVLLLIFGVGFGLYFTFGLNLKAIISSCVTFFGLFMISFASELAMKGK